MSKSISIAEALRLGVDAHTRGAYNEADRFYTLILNTNKGHPAANHNMGILAIQLGKLGRSVDFLRASTRAAPQNIQYKLSFIEALFRLNRIQEVRDVIAEAKLLDPSNKTVQAYEEKLVNLDAENAVKENKLFLGILDSHSLTAAIRLAEKKHKIGDVETAKSIYEEILATYPGNRKAKRGISLIIQRNTNQVTESVDPPTDCMSDILSSYSQNEFEQVLHRAQKLLLEYPRSRVLFNTCGVSLARLGRYEEALEYYEHTIAVDPEFVEVYNNKGNTLRELGHTDAAIKSFLEAVKLKPNYAEAYYNLGLAYQQSGDHENAIKSYKKTIKIKPHYSDAYNNLGNIFIEAGDLGAATDAFREVITRDPNHIEALENLQLIHTQNRFCDGKIAQILSEAEKVSIKKLETKPLYLIQRAICKYCDGERSQCLEYLNQYSRCKVGDFASLDEQNKKYTRNYFNYLSRLLTQFPSNQIGVEKKVYHIGESHCLSFAHQKVSIGGDAYNIEPLITFGAKAFHFSKDEENSYKSITRRNLFSIPNNSTILLSFGEIDCRSDEGFITAIGPNNPLESLIDVTVKGYVNWFLQQNDEKKHKLIFLNLPAPVFVSSRTRNLNDYLRTTIRKFNAVLQTLVTKSGYQILDVYKLTSNNDGYSNNLFHVDYYHLGPKIIPKLNFD